MKEKLGISMTAVRPLLWKVILILVLTVAVQLFFGFQTAAAFHQSDTTISITADNFDPFLSESHTALIATLGLLALAAVLALQGCQFSGRFVNGTLQRLPLGEGAVTVIYGLTHLGFLLLYWVVELFTVVGLWWVFAGAGGFAMIFAAYTTPFFHSLLPLSDWPRLLLTGLSVVALAMTTTYFGFFQRRGSFPVSPCLVLVAGLIPFGVSGDVGMEILFVVVLSFFIVWQFLWMRAEVREHGKQED